MQWIAVPLRALWATRRQVHVIPTGRGPCSIVPRSSLSMAAAAAADDCHVVWLGEVGSTQDEMRSRLPLAPGVLALAVCAENQIVGRGTRGRDWFGAPGNVFLTVALPMARLPVPLTLVPLRVGVTVGRVVSEHLSTSEPGATVTLKWPNDILVDRRKVAGVLIEGDGTHLLVGIGVNVAHAPSVPTSGPQCGRPATCLKEHGGDASPDAVKAIAAAIARGLASWVGAGTDSAGGLRSEWSDMVDWSEALVLRDDGAVVQPLRLEADGMLAVRVSDTGKERLLVAEYLL